MKMLGNTSGAPCENLDCDDISSPEDSSQGDEKIEEVVKKTQGEARDLIAEMAVTNNGFKYIPNVPSEDLPYVGKTFISWEEALDFYKHYARIAGFGSRRHSCILSRDGTGYRSRTFTCCRQGTTNLNYQKKEKHKKRRSGVRKRGHTRCLCSASMTVKKLKNGNTWVVSVFKAEHSHPLTSPRKVGLLPSYRRVTPAQRSLLDHLSQANVRTCQQFRFLESLHDGPSSVGCQQQDIYNVERDKRQKKKGRDAETLLKYFECEKEADRNYYYSMETEGGVFDRCFWADSTSRSAYAYFGDVVVFDTTYNTNMYGMILAPFVGVNHHRETVLFGCGLLSNEKKESFIWLFSQFLESMPTGAAPKVIITDQDQAIGGAISTVFPPAVHRLCLWHITNKFSEKLGPTLYGDYNSVLSGIVSRFETAEEFGKKWGVLMGTTPLGGNEWLRNMYAIRERWVPAYVNHLFAAGMTSSQRVESHHSFLKLYVIRKNSLSDFMVQFTHALRHQRHLELQADHVDKNEVPILLTHHHMETQMRSVYTKTLFLLFQEELVQSLSYDYEKISSMEDAKVYRVSRFDTVSDRSRHVTWNTGDNIMLTCSCRLFEFSGYLCRHILCLLYSKRIRTIPDHYILSRWGKHAKSVPIFDSTRAIVAIELPDYAHGKMITEFVSFANEMSTLPDVKNFFMEGFSELRRKTREMMARVGPENANNDRVQVEGTSEEEVLSIQDPLPVHAKGSGKRLKTAKEKAIGQGGRRCRRCKKPGHNAKTCQLNNSRTMLIDDDYHPDMSNVHNGVGDEASAYMFISQGADNYSVYPTTIPEDDFLE